MAKAEKNAEQLIAMFRELLNTLPHGTASVESGRTKNDDGTLVWLKPSNNQAAVFSAHLEDSNPSLIDVSFGSGSTFELPWESKLPKDATFEMTLNAVKDMAQAVIAGRCKERFGFLSVLGTIQVDTGNVYRCTHWFSLRLFPKTTQYSSFSSTMSDSLSG